MEKPRGLWSEVCWSVCDQGQCQGGHADRAHVPGAPSCCLLDPGLLKLNGPATQEQNCLPSPTSTTHIVHTSGNPKAAQRRVFQQGQQQPSDSA